MNKIILIIKREYLTRVRKRTFIISTLLFPLLYLGLIFGTGYITEKTKKQLQVAVIDSSGTGYFSEPVLFRYNELDPNSLLAVPSQNPDSVKMDLKRYGYDAYIVIPPL